MGGPGGHTETVSADAKSPLELERVSFKAIMAVQGGPPTR